MHTLICHIDPPGKTYHRDADGVITWHQLQLARSQRYDIPVQLNHDGEACGRVVYLERSEQGSTYAVATTSLEDLDVFLHPSIQAYGRRNRDDCRILESAVIEHVALVVEPVADVGPAILVRHRLDNLPPVMTTVPIWAERLLRRARQHQTTSEDRRRRDQQVWYPDPAPESRVLTHRTSEGIIDRPAARVLTHDVGGRLGW